MIVTTPASWCDVGHTLYVIGSAAEYGIRYADWVDRLLRPHPNLNGNGKAHGFGVDTRAAEQRLLEALRNGTVHESLVDVEEPRVAA